jgi:UDP-N-acetylglucosamine 2-epimerase (non-hydrolysing)/GDP/UDP-N,N'-diacetylbacillosamine 2-epimerase (hydrolysing)
MTKKRICVVTGTRAEYGLLHWVMEGIRQSPVLELQLIATGMHLSPEFGLTYRAIETDGFVIDRKVEMLLSSDTPIGVTKSMGLGMIGFADAFCELKPDMVLLLGDRFELLAAAQVTMISQIPLIHLAGGDNALGTYDNIIRHCITKIAALHFVTNEEARRRVIQLGERPDRVFCYGSTSVDNIVRMTFLSRQELENDLKIKFCENIFLITFHPLTMDRCSGEIQFKTLLTVLNDFLIKQKYTLIFTKSNTDNGGHQLNQMIKEFITNKPHCFLFDSLGQQRYLNVLKYASVIIGNSSSGIYEAPYLNTPTVDIGNRQLKRAAPTSVFRCHDDENSIKNAIQSALKFEFNDVKKIYGEGSTSEKIVRKIEEFSIIPNLSVKEFQDIEVESDINFG